MDLLGQTFMSENKPIVSYSSLAFLESGSLGRTRLCYSFWASCRCSPFAVSTEPSLPALVLHSAK